MDEPKKVANPKAFPVEIIQVRERGYPTEWVVNEGMSLRDYFAARVIEALIHRNGLDVLSYGKMAEESYKVADAMLKER